MAGRVDAGGRLIDALISIVFRCFSVFLECGRWGLRALDGAGGCGRGREIESVSWGHDSSFGGDLEGGCGSSVAVAGRHRDGRVEGSVSHTAILMMGSIKTARIATTSWCVMACPGAKRGNLRQLYSY